MLINIKNKNSFDIHLPIQSYTKFNTNATYWHKLVVLSVNSIGINDIQYNT